ncbi:MAG: ISL3 family transposase [Desulfobacterales bacterium]|nr:ISL3 family transposase [Desulfobacterales bacterium]
MTINKFIRKLLKLKGLCVTGFKFANRNTVLNLWVKPHKNGCLCPYCGRRGRIVRTMMPRMWRDLSVCGCCVLFWYCPREIQCPIHGRIQEDIPWAESYARITYRFEYAMLIYCQLMTQKAAAKILHIAGSTISDLLHRSITRIRDGHRIRGLKCIGIDEISYCKGHKYASIVYDLDRSCVVWVGQGKGRETIDIFFNEVLSEYQKNKIKWASCDMSETYIGAIEDHCPNATLVLDRFHVVKALNKAVDEVRKEQWRNACADERKALKGLRWLLFKHSSNRSKKDSRILNALRKGNRRIHRAWVLSDEFERFWDYKVEWAAKRFLKRWMTTALKSRIEPIRKFVRTIKKHIGRILPYIGSRLTNAIGEGLNRIIKIVKNRASGFRTLHPFTDMIFLTVGDVDIPAQIPAKFRAL